MAIRAGRDALLTEVGDANNVVVGKDIHQTNNVLDSEPLGARLVRLEVRLTAIERAQSNAGWAVLIVALALVAQVIWVIQSQNSALRDISDKITDTNQRIVRLEALWATSERYRQGTPTPE